MPSPIAHAAAAYAIYRVVDADEPQERQRNFGPFPLLLLVILALSMLPDLDFLPGLLFGEPDEFHNTISHSLFMGVAVSPLVATFLWVVWRKSFLFWLGLSLLCYETHVIMDYFTLGRGLMILWPFSAERFEPAVKLFYGLHRSAGWVSIRHLWTLLSETAFAVTVFLGLRVLEAAVGAVRAHQ